GLRPRTFGKSGRRCRPAHLPGAAKGLRGIAPPFDVWHFSEPEPFLKIHSLCGPCSGFTQTLPICLIGFLARPRERASSDDMQIPLKKVYHLCEKAKAGVSRLWFFTSKENTYCFHTLESFSSFSR